MTYCYQKFLLGLSLCLMLGNGGAIAASLEGPIEDPAIPQLKIDRPLSPLEVGNIRRTAADLLISGEQLWLTQQPELAFVDWFRHLRLLQILPDRQAEIMSLGNIGAIAWENNRVQDTRAIMARLDLIRDTEFQTDETLLLPLAAAYEQLRNSESAIALYQTHLDSLDDPYKPEILRLIAQLAINWLNYERAVVAYEQIQALDALNIPDREQFARLYEKLKQYDQAIAIQQRLPDLYLQDQNFEQLIKVYLDMAENFYNLGQYKNAINFNEAAFELAWQLEQFAASERALKNLAQVYLAQDNNDFAIQVYEQLLIVQNISYNRFGMMETYDTLGQLYQQKIQYPEALISFQKGLAIAKELNHNISIFTQAIETLPLNESPIQ
ncbi:MAG: tetratricopeptide repeat protein [Limnothrix sp.]